MYSMGLLKNLNTKELQPVKTAMVREVRKKKFVVLVMVEGLM